MAPEQVLIGVGVTFLEETFNSSAASPDHRYHQEAARAVLKDLLPDFGTDIKGYIRSSRRKFFGVCRTPSTSGTLGMLT